MSAQHTVEVVGSEDSPRGCHAECTCGWTSTPKRGRHAHVHAVSAKWGHVDEVTGATP